MDISSEGTHPVSGLKVKMKPTKKITPKHHLSSLTPERKSTQYCQWIMQFYVDQPMAQHLEEDQLVTYTLLMVSKQGTVG